MRRRRRGYPFQRTGLPGIAPCSLAPKQAVNEVKQEQALEEQHDHQRYGGHDAQILQAGGGQLREILKIEDAAMLPCSAQQEERDEDEIERHDGAPEMNLPEDLRQMPTEHLGIPVINSRKHRDD